MISACILGCSGPRLTDAERGFFRDARPWGFVLFKRNTESPDQTRALIEDLRACLGRAAPVAIDQEGGRVQRLGPPHWPRYPAGRAYGLAGGDLGAQEGLARLGARLIAHDLAALGITIDLAPVLDTPQPGAHDVIGDRAFGHDPDRIAALGRAFCDGLLAGGVLPTIKHMPGHGRAMADSHHDLPVVETSLDELAASDFRAFEACSDMPVGMTAHVVYTAIDPQAPATTSPAAIRLIRERLGFDGLLMTDDLSMKALKGGFRARAEASTAAGCDLVQHCNGDMAEMVETLAGCAELAGEALRRADAALARIATAADPFDVDQARARFTQAFPGYGSS